MRLVTNQSLVGLPFSTDIFRAHERTRGSAFRPENVCASRPCGWKTGTRVPAYPSSASAGGKPLQGSSQNLREEMDGRVLRFQVLGEMDEGRWRYVDSVLLYSILMLPSSDVAVYFMALRQDGGGTPKEGGPQGPLFCGYFSLSAARSASSGVEGRRAEARTASSEPRPDGSLK